MTTPLEQKLDRANELVAIRMRQWDLMYVALAKLVCPACDHELQHHFDPQGCEIERGDDYRHAEFQEALGPCGCNVDDLSDDYPDFVRALEAFRTVKGESL